MLAGLNGIMTKYLSSKLTVLYTLLIIMVVYIHSYYLEARQYPNVLFIQNFCGTKGVCRIANCLFFCISGYLFARNITSSKDVWIKLKNRWRSLLPPYILWNIIFVLWFVVLAIVPGADRFNNSGAILGRMATQPVLDSFYEMFVVPAAFHLWFLRDLLLMLLLTPLLCWIAKKQWHVAFLLAICSTVVYSWLVYFWMGIIIAMRRWDIENYWRPKWAIAGAVVIFVGYSVYLALGNNGIMFIGLFTNLIGIYLVWVLYDIIACGRCLSDMACGKYIYGYSFFIYCFHEPALNVIKKLPLFLCGTSEPVLILFFLVNPWIMVAVAVITAKILQHMTPRMYKILTGGR